MCHIAFNLNLVFFQRVASLRRDVDGGRAGRREAVEGVPHRAHASGKATEEMQVEQHIRLTVFV